MDCSVPAERAARTTVMKIYAKKVQHTKDVLFVSLVFEGDSVKLYEAATGIAVDHGNQHSLKNIPLLEIAGTSIDLVRLSKRDATFFYFTTRNGVFSCPSNRPPVIKNAEGSISGFDVFAFHATCPRAAERCYRYLLQYAEVNLAAELSKLGSIAADASKPGTSLFKDLNKSFYGVFSPPPAIRLYPEPSALPTVNFNNNIIEMSSVDSDLAKGAAHVEQGSLALEQGESCRTSNTFANCSPSMAPAPPSSDLMLLNDFGADQATNVSMSDLFDDLVTPGAAPRKESHLGGSEVDLLDDLFKTSSVSVLPRPLPPPLLQQQQILQPQLMPSNPFAASVYTNLSASNPFATPAPPNTPTNGHYYHGQRKSTSAFSTDFNDFLQQTVKGHFKA